MLPRAELPLGITRNEGFSTAVLSGKSNSPAAALRMKVRVKKWRVVPKGWTPFWKATAYASAGVSVGLAGLFVWLLLSLLWSPAPDHAASAWDVPLQWLDLGRRLAGVKASVVPEPSRVVLVAFAMMTAFFRRRR